MNETISRIETMRDLTQIAKVCEMLESSTYYQLERLTAESSKEEDAIEKLYGVAYALGMLKDSVSRKWDELDNLGVSGTHGDEQRNNPTP